MKDEKV